MACRRVDLVIDVRCAIGKAECHLAGASYAGTEQSALHPFLDAMLIVLSTVHVSRTVTADLLTLLILPTLSQISDRRREDPSVIHRYPALRVW